MQISRDKALAAVKEDVMSKIKGMEIVYCFVLLCCVSRYMYQCIVSHPNICLK